MRDLREICVDRAQLLQELDRFKGDFLGVLDLGARALGADEVLQDKVKGICYPLCEGFVLEDLFAPGGELLHYPYALSGKLEIGSADRPILVMVIAIFLRNVSRVCLLLTLECFNLLNLA